MTLLTILDK